MTGFRKPLNQKIDTIVEQWVDAVRQDKQITTTQELTYVAVRDSLPRVLEAMAFLQLIRTPTYKLSARFYDRIVAL